jgi:hypothetical protein
MKFTVRGVPQEVADEVRRTRRSPGFGHPAYEEIASGTGPCRCCLRPFAPGVDPRLLFTYRPGGRGGSLLAPGPVFIHAGHCEAWQGEGFPDALRKLPLAFEAHVAGSRITGLCARADLPAEARVRELFAAQAEWLHLRHAQAGCFIARIEAGTEPACAA